VHLVHGWAAPRTASAWLDLVEFVSGHHVVRLLATGVSDGPTDPARVAGVLLETDRGAVGTVAVSPTRPVEGGALHLTLDGAEESISFHEGRPEVLDVVGDRSTQRFQRGVGADVSRYSTQPVGQPQGHHECWVSYVADAHAAAGGARPDGLPTLADLARSAALTAAVQESTTTSAWTRVRPDDDPDLITTIEGKTA
jgi:hypothetical protein